MANIGSMAILETYLALEVGKTATTAMATTVRTANATIKKIGRKVGVG